MHALLEHLPQDSTPVVAVVKSEPGSPNPAKPNGHPSLAVSNYNPSTIYILELASMQVIKNKDGASAVGKDVVEALQNILRNSNSYHPLIVSRTAFYLLHILNANHVGFYISQ